MRENTKIKICGLYRLEDIYAVNEVMPDYVGFIMNFPMSHRSVNIDQIAKFKLKLRKQIKTVGVFVNANTEYIIEASKYLDIIQLHGDETNHEIECLRRNLYKKEIWKAFKIRNIQDLEKAESSIADKVILDNGYGTGEVFDWSLLKFMKSATKTIILAGGITVENLPEAIEKFHPFAVDISSGVETNRLKDREKIRKVVEITRMKKENNNE